MNKRQILIEETRNPIRAGVIPYCMLEGEIHFMFMKPTNWKYGGDFFQISKGAIEPNETVKEAAMREGEEELGLQQSNIEFIKELGNYIGGIFFYYVKILDPLDFTDPSAETLSTTWMTNQQFQEEGRDLHKPIVQEAYERICEIEGIKYV